MTATGSVAGSIGRPTAYDYEYLAALAAAAATADADRRARHWSEHSVREMSQPYGTVPACGLVSTRLGAETDFAFARCRCGYHGSVRPDPSAPLEPVYLAYRAHRGVADMWRAHLLAARLTTAAVTMPTDDEIRALSAGTEDQRVLALARSALGEPTQAMWPTLTEVIRARVRCAAAIAGVA